MKLLYILFLFPVMVLGQTQTENYIRKDVYRSATLASNPSLANTSVTYYDGLGRPIQIVAAKAGGNGQDLVTPIIYDSFGRETKIYLPFTDSNQLVSSLGYRPNSSLQPQISTLYSTKFPQDLASAIGGNPYSENVFEASPLDRILEQAAPGDSWSLTQGHTVKISYSTNKLYEVRRFEVTFSNPNNTEDTQLHTTGFYDPGQLYKTVTKDENWTVSSGVNNTIQEFKDKEGRVVLKRSFNQSQPHDTYYVYDRYGNLTYVIPPLASDQLVEGGATPISYLSRNFPWTNLVVVDKELAQAYNRKLMDYENEEILTADLENEYNAQGGFNVSPGMDGGIALTINFTTNTPLPLRTGTLLDLSEYGVIADQELGRISGTDYEYVFTVKSNLIIVSGSGEVPSTTITFGDIQEKLSYTKNYPWTDFVKADPEIKDEYTAAIASLDNSQLLNPGVITNYGAYGGVGVSLDENNMLTLTFALDSQDHPMDIDPETGIKLEFHRRLPDTIFGNISGSGFSYKIKIQDNSIYFIGEGSIANFTGVIQHTFTQEPYINNTVIDGLCYIYHYDIRNRVIEKHIPGKGWEYIVYDKLDHPALIQDEKLRLANNWLFTKYDIFGRVAYTGMIKYLYDEESEEENLGLPPSIAVRRQLQRLINYNVQPFENRAITTFMAGNAEINYTKDLFPSDNSVGVDSFEIFTASYYDDYNVQPFGQPLTLPTTNDYASALSNAARSLPTATLVRVLDTDDWGFTINGYDNEGRVIWSKAGNTYLQTNNITHLLLDFTGKVTESTTIHNKANITTGLVTVNKFAYDNMGRVLKETSQINNFAEELIVWNSYDELGQLQGKKVGNTPGSSYSITSKLQEVNYSYNIRGWLRSINNTQSPLTDDLFGFNLEYDSGSTPLYNGNISSTQWRSKTDNKLRRYDYLYDKLNRLTQANYTGNYTIAINNEIENYFEGAIRYDKNGNITHLERYGLTANSLHVDKIDQLEYIYEPTSNRLQQVVDAGDTAGFSDANNATGTDYGYDINGNMTSDYNKNITKIEYNHLNLPTRVVIGADPMYNSTNPKYINYVYDATGVKLEKRVTQKPPLSTITTTTTQYAGTYVYQGGKLEYFGHDEGYITPVRNRTNIIGYDYIYQYKDHLGNVRLSYGDSDHNGTISQNEIVAENNYYAFGLEHKGYDITTSGGNAVAEKKMYNGKELHEEFNLNWYDYGTRNYDAVIGRWMNIDPLAEKAYTWTPFRYAFDNPVKFLDKNGQYETDGHYWTVYLAGLVTGRNDAYSLAYWAEEPDHIMSFGGDIAYATNTWMYPRNQQDWHALTGGNPSDERNKSRKMFLDAADDQSKGRALHRLGDSYSHSKEDAPKMFGKLIGHGYLGTAPDKIANRPELYLEYVRDLISTLGGNNKTDMFAFNYIASAGTSSEANMAILETEVRIREGIKTFSVSGNHKSAINSYLKSRGTKYGQKSAKTLTAEADVYKMNEKTGKFEKTGTETRTFVIFN